MRFKDVFSIIGPAMVGPSSSHTAGAARIGRAARQVLGEMPREAEVIFFGSFAATYQGHGTDRAIIGGLLDFATDDHRLPDSVELAAEAGMDICFRQGTGLFPHPNTVRLRLVGRDTGIELTLTGISIGGGNIEIVDIDGFGVKLTGMYPTVLINHMDYLGVLASVTDVMRRGQFNIGHMSLDRKNRSGAALTVLELDEPATAELLQELQALTAVKSVRLVDLNGVKQEQKGKESTP
ncbi:MULTISPECIES: L-serine ammonia-lyase, iron-sulfur-dependent subunit beta [unclassified Paenibacillus]|uniref:L-serine ammonia-lyase, iron-sulfur-dependent subunit beta n=1 Tax=unclassified Paenibacillus TaxID=185978 RepID=UPI002405B324|nr:MULTISPECIES: L-serine ammonia-lyase, iron-sulfur-dependent subunit beta [unclassified Paenibacillus]MDF9840972.1 L-serine dehydratase [Paenibacillus sp. PastF-2]MDF9847556.1 L-serine dehydratase [Paenibacillus sp. PastM-2]MDF9853868.1 L-serine dehydratase [Paenibacillus sp. PastF-1]MDH6479139.1 L-serine dehydratase [Paenibacillus sp. PastH-2]MDH6507124.1 L-serine dehydratase [Paenibacillus sp. PastM-3]